MAAATMGPGAAGWRAVSRIALACACAGCSVAQPADGGAPSTPVVRDLAAARDLSAARDLAAAPPADLAAVDLSPPATPDLVDPANPFGIRLTDVTDAALGGPITSGIASILDVGMGGGAAIGDLDGDGWLDLIVARFDDPMDPNPHGPTLMFRGRPPVGGVPGPRFDLDPDFTALTAGVLAHGVALGDVDGDGDLDVFIAASGPDRLLRNDGAGHFTDISAAAGVSGPAHNASSMGLFADFNHDGLLDLFVLHVYVPMPDLGQPADPRLASRLHLNLGDGTFADVSDAAAINGPGAAWSANAFDLDGAGDLALYVTMDRYTVDGMPSNYTDRLPPDHWYHLDTIDDEGVPRFSDVNVARGVVYPHSGMDVAIADVDGDLTPDIYLTDLGRNALYLNRRPGAAITEDAAAFNLGAGQDADGVYLSGWGAQFVDLDRDGNLELFLINGSVYWPSACERFHQVPWYLRQPAPGAPYDLITASVGLAVPVPKCPGGVGDAGRTAGRSLVTGDLDGDGDDDFVLTTAGFAYHVLRNDTPPVHHALRVRLLGTVSSPDPIGATLITTRLDGRRVARFRDTGGVSFSQSDAVLTVGLGDDAAVARAEVRWPSGLVERIDQRPEFAIDRVVTITEPRWLTLSPQQAWPGGPAPQLVYQPVDESGAPLGKAAAGRNVSLSRSDGVPATIVDRGDGTYAAILPHPGTSRRTTLTLTDGATLRPRPMIVYR